MGALTKRPKTRWLAPAPLWAAESAAVLASKPALLRFDTDDFMDELVEVLERDPQSLWQWRARPETWRAPLPRPAATRASPPPKSPLTLKIPRRLARPQPPQEAEATPPPDDAGRLKLFQAAHQRYYLVAASLAKMTKGLGDRCLEPARGQSASFVVRRLVRRSASASEIPDLASWQELAYVRGTDGYVWRAVSEARRDRPEPSEQTTPLFPISYGEPRRRLLAGLVPVAKREAYLGAPPETPSDLPPASTPDLPEPSVAALRRTAERMSDPRLARLRLEVLEPWRALVEQARSIAIQAADWRSNQPTFNGELGDPPLDADDGRSLATFEQIQTGSWYVARDLLAFLAEHLPAVFDAVRGDTTALDALDLEASTAQGAVLDWLTSVTAVASTVPFTPVLHGYALAPHLRAFLAALSNFVDLEDPRQDPLERVEVPFSTTARDPDWPTVLFPLADPEDPDGAGPLPAGAFASPEAAVASLEDLVEAALAPSSDDTYARQVPLPHALDATEGWFWIRCVFEDPQCEPFFGPLVSAPTAPFQMAPFFDPDAPARPIRISMPMDISPAGLRKYSKNASFVISDMLCSKLKSIRKLTLGDLVLSVLPWPFHKDLPTPDEPGPCKDNGVNFGWVISLSIPIVTLCAMILMFIIVLLFDTIFRWVPYLLVAFRIPGLKSKS